MVGIHNRSRQNDEIMKRRRTGGRRRECGGGGNGSGRCRRDHEHGEQEPEQDSKTRNATHSHLHRAISLRLGNRVGKSDRETGNPSGRAAGEGERHYSTGKRKSCPQHLSTNGRRTAISRPNRSAASATKRMIISIREGKGKFPIPSRRRGFFLPVRVLRNSDP